ncbi:hypothetical protein, partial [Helicobacter cappadocius]
MKNIMNSDKNNKIMSSNAQNSVIAPPPLTFLKSNSLENFENPKKSRSTEKYNKSFIPVISFVLSTFLFSFSGELRADTLGDASCTLGDSASCATFSTTSDFSNYLNLVSKGSGVYDLSYSQAPANANFPNVTLNANNAVINSNLIGNGLYGTGLSNQNMQTIFNLKNSVWNGNFIVSSGNYAGFGFTTTFDGNYNDTDNTANPLNGYALKGNITSPYSTSNSTFNFNNGAKMAGNISFASTGTFNFNSGSSLQGNISSSSGSTINVNFADSSMKGNVSAYSGTINTNFTNSSMIGSIFNSTATSGTTAWNWNLDNSSIDATNGGVSVRNYSTFNFSLANKSSLTGAISVKDLSTLNLNLANSSSLVGNLSMENYSTLNLNLTNNSTFKGSTSSDYQGVLKATFANSSMEGNITNNSNRNRPYKVQTYTFSGNSDEGFALKGLNGANSKINSYQGVINLNFDNGAKAYADITANVDGYSYGSLPTINMSFKNNSTLNGSISEYPHGRIKATFIDSSMEGNITNFRSNFDGTNSQTYTFSGNSDKGFALKGLNGANSKIQTARNGINLTFDNGAKAYADIETAGGDTAATGQNVSLTLKNNSFLQGSVTGYYGYINANLTDSSMTGSVLNSTGATWKWNLDNSKIDASSGGINVKNNSTLNLTLNNNSSILGNITTTTGSTNLTL